jgi:hypothetical protein
MISFSEKLIFLLHTQIQKTAIRRNGGFLSKRVNFL